MLFSAGLPLGEQKLGTDIPTTFKLLYIGPIVYSQPRLPGYLSTSTVQKISASLGASMHAVPYILTVASISLHTSDTCYRMLEPGVSISFEHTEKEGSTLVTKYPTY